jgi:protocatechuate 3,4-dioxygenase beta subunit
VPSFASQTKDLPVMKNEENPRRQFLRTIALTTAAVGLAPVIGTSKNALGALAVPPAGACDATTEDYYGEGPFYTVNPPDITNSQLADDNEPGTRLIISGVVRTLDCSQVIPNAEIDIWHADDNGGYDNTGGYHLRGKTYSNSQGFYMFETVKPGKYLNGSQYRPSHIHFKITAPSFGTLTTQLYFEGDVSIPIDAAASITSGTFDATPRIIQLDTNGENELEGTWDIIIDGNGETLGTNNLHLNRGMIYDAGPNPFTNELQINYGVFRDANVKLSVFDVNGKLAAVLDEKQLSTDKYSAIWHPDSSVRAGHYFISLMINEMQVHYLKVVKL